MPPRKRAAEEEDELEVSKVTRQLRRLGDDPDEGADSASQVSMTQFVQRQRLLAMVEKNKRQVMPRPEVEAKAHELFAILQRWDKQRPKEQSLQLQTARAEVAWPTQVNAKVMTELLQKKLAEAQSGKLVSNNELQDICFVAQEGEGFAGKVKFTDPLVHVVNQAFWTRLEIVLSQPAATRQWQPMQVLCAGIAKVLKKMDSFQAKILEKTLDKVRQLFDVMPEGLEQKLEWYASCLGWQTLLVVSSTVEIPSHVNAMVAFWQRDNQKCKQEFEKLLDTIKSNMTDQSKKNAVEAQLERTMLLYGKTWGEQYRFRVCSVSLLGLVQTAIQEVNAPLEMLRELFETHFQRVEKLCANVRQSPSEAPELHSQIRTEIKLRWASKSGLQKLLEEILVGYFKEWVSAYEKFWDLEDDGTMLPEEFLQRWSGPHQSMRELLKLATNQAAAQATKLDLHARTLNIQRARVPLPMENSQLPPCTALKDKTVPIEEAQAQPLPSPTKDEEILLGLVD